MPAVLAQDRGKAFRILKLITVVTLRRVIEYGFVLGLFIALSPVFLVISVLVKLTTYGSVFVRRHSLSHGGRSLTLYSFRTRIPLYDYTGKAFFMSSENDSRYTWFGKILHKSSLHLLPRLWNVLNGDLNFIGVTPLYTDLVVNNFSKELLKKERNLVADLYDVSEGEIFYKLMDYCIPVGLVTYADLNAYKVIPWRAKVIKSRDMRPRLIKEADYFLFTTFPSTKLFVILIGKFIFRLLSAINLVTLEEIPDGKV
jgi:hypothetical protein